MPDEQAVDVQAETNQADPVAEQNSGPAASGEMAVAGQRTFSQEDVERIVKERLKRAEEKARKDADQVRAETERKSAEEQGKFKELYDSTLAELEEMRSRAKSLEMQALRRQVAERVGVPATLADRLRGDTEDEIESDAKGLLASLPRPAAPNINSSTSAATGQRTGQWTEEERKELSSIYRVNPKHFGVQ